MGQITTLAIQMTIWTLSAILQLTIAIIKVVLPFLFKSSVAGWKALSDRLNEPRRVLDTHILSPDDRPPASFSQDHYDYRGIAKEPQLSQLRESGVSLGRYLYPDGAIGNQL